LSQELSPPVPAAAAGRAGTSDLIATLRERAPRTALAFAAGQAAWPAATWLRGKARERTTYTVKVSGLDGIYDDLHEWVLGRLPATRQRAVNAWSTRSRVRTPFSSLTGPPPRTRESREGGSLRIRGFSRYSAACGCHGKQEAAVNQEADERNANDHAGSKPAPGREAARPRVAQDRAGPAARHLGLDGMGSRRGQRRRAQGRRPRSAAAVRDRAGGGRHRGRRRAGGRVGREGRPARPRVLERPHRAGGLQLLEHAAPYRVDPVGRRDNDHARVEGRARRLHGGVRRRDRAARAADAGHHRR
jgi:hypothetical protein